MMSLCDTDQALATQLPAYARRVLDVLEAAGFEAWVVGGWVRDALLENPSHDVDVTTSAPWRDAERVLRAAGMAVHETGTKHGTVTAVVDGKPVETTTYRVESGYSDLRHPDEVRFVRDVREDLARRDFTVNAMAFHPERGLLDLFGGVDDLASRVIRCVGNPRDRFGEDALRVLRAVRFAARMGFSVEQGTHDALVECAGELSHIAQERIGQEVDGILSSGRMGWALLAETEVMCAAIPELAPMVGFDQHSAYHAFDVYEHTARVCRAVEAFSGGVPSRELRWAALLHDVAKPECFSLDALGRGHFFGHPEAGAKVARKVMGRLAIPGDVVRPTAALIQLHDRCVPPTTKSVRKALRALEQLCPGRAVALAYELVDLKRADTLAKAPDHRDFVAELARVEAVIRDEARRGVTLSVRDLAVNGQDVIRECGIRPGPGVGAVLDTLLSQVISGELENEREALLEALRP